MPSAKAQTLSPFDPLRFIGLDAAQEVNDASEKTSDSQGDPQTHGKNTAPSSPLDRAGAYAALRRMPAALRTPLSDLEELIIRDCICGWYNYHSFGDQSLPNEARYSIDHAIGSIYAALENSKSADIAAELLLGAASVLLVTLRYRRIHPDRAPIFSSDKARVDALRDALNRVFRRHSRKEDADCDLIRVLLREIISKQVWNAVCGIAGPQQSLPKFVEQVGIR